MLKYFRTTKLLVQSIDVGERAFPPTAKRVTQLARSLKDDDQHYPILVRQVTSDSFKVICGATRLRAARELGWDYIQATIVGGLPIDYQIAELSDDNEHKILTRQQHAELRRKLKELRRARATAAGEVSKAKGGRGRKGGVAEAARQAGIARSTAQRHAKSVQDNVHSGQVSDNVEHAFKTCPYCKGRGIIRASRGRPRSMTANA
jgi:ParB-like chromosome segregation protein Spo0J